ncbi:MAG: hypothetical protein IPK16_31165 [Anaerolineales bacterium]|nr:hypothetical protein [Anaerolineales bacterium]
MVTSQTEIKVGSGEISQGACVKVHLQADGTTVRELEIESAEACAAGDDSSSAVFAAMW